MVVRNKIVAVFSRINPYNLYSKSCHHPIYSDILFIILYVSMLFFYRFMRTISVIRQKTSELLKNQEVQRFLFLA